MDTSVSESAAEIIRQGGGRLYIWQEPLGRGALDRAALTRPELPVRFVSHGVGGDLHVCLDSALTPPDSLSIREASDGGLLEIYLDHLPWHAELEDAKPEIRASNEAARFIKQRGGRLYVWIDKAGLAHVKTDPPTRSHEFIEIELDGFRFYQDRLIKTPRFWKLSLRRFPSRIDVLWNGHTGPSPWTQG